MANLVQELREYLRKTPAEQKARDREELSVFGDYGPLVLDYLDTISETIPEISISNGSINPEFSLDFSLV
ncbi:MAG: hypothetical protein IK113_08075 [Bacteroidales bacterium]|nr:hypothetical protein [Bacteroidales bacterium]